MEDLRDRSDEQRLRQARRAGDQAMPAGEAGDQHLLDDFALADDHLGQLFVDACRGFDEFVRRSVVRVRVRFKLAGHARSDPHSATAVQCVMA